jgi:hypothetical protein
MTTLLMIPAIASGSLTTKVNGRTYTCAAGATISVPDFDGAELAANGWLVSLNAPTGTTGQRPVAPAVGTVFVDSTVGGAVVYVGKSPAGAPVWVHHATGVAS